MRLGLSSGGKCDGLPRLAQLVEHLTVVVSLQNVSADIRVSPVQVWERGPMLEHERERLVCVRYYGAEKRTFPRK